ncbi:MAG: hypothetical protein ACI85I_001544 [Arenicella sp.]|jgi:hypothetical protein
MDIKEIENKLAELKGKQAEVFNKKKADRDSSVLDGIRTEINDLKAQAKEAYGKRQKDKKSEAHQQKVEATAARKASK